MSSPPEGLCADDVRIHAAKMNRGHAAEMSFAKMNTLYIQATHGEDRGEGGGRGAGVAGGLGVRFAVLSAGQVPNTVGSHDFNSHDFKLRASDPRTTAYFHFGIAAARSAQRRRRPPRPRPMPRRRRRPTPRRRRRPTRRRRRRPTGKPRRPCRRCQTCRRRRPSFQGLCFIRRNL